MNIKTQVLENIEHASVSLEKYKDYFHQFNHNSQMLWGMYLYNSEFKNYPDYLLPSFSSNGNHFLSLNPLLDIQHSIPVKQFKLLNPGKNLGELKIEYDNEKGEIILPLDFYLRQKSYLAFSESLKTISERSLRFIERYSHVLNKDKRVYESFIQDYPPLDLLLMLSSLPLDTASDMLPLINKKGIVLPEHMTVEKLHEIMEPKYKRSNFDNGQKRVYDMFSYNKLMGVLKSIEPFMQGLSTIQMKLRLEEELPEKTNQIKKAKI